MNSSYLPIIVLLTNGFMTLTAVIYETRQRMKTDALVLGNIAIDYQPISILLLGCLSVLSGTKSSWKLVSTWLYY